MFIIWARAVNSGKDIQNYSKFPSKNIHNDIFTLAQMFRQYAASIYGNASACVRIIKKSTQALLWPGWHQVAVHLYSVHVYALYETFMKT